VGVNATLKLVKNDFRHIMAIADNAFEEEPDVRDEFHKGGPIGRGVPRAIRAFESLVALAEKHRTELFAWGLTDARLDEARTHLRALVEADTAQEGAMKELSPKTRELNQAKGRAYLLLKKLARTGRSVFASQPQTSAKFDLEILNRAAPSAKITPSATITQ